MDMLPLKIFAAAETQLGRFVLVSGIQLVIAVITTAIFYETYKRGAHTASFLTSGQTYASHVSDLITFLMPIYLGLALQKWTNVLNALAQANAALNKLYLLLKGSNNFKKDEKDIDDIFKPYEKCVMNAYLTPLKRSEKWEEDLYRSVAEIDKRITEDDVDDAEMYNDRLTDYVDSLVNFEMSRYNILPRRYISLLFWVLVLYYGSIYPLATCVEFGWHTPLHVLLSSIVNNLIYIYGTAWAEPFLSSKSLFGEEKAYGKIYLGFLRQGHFAKESTKNGSKNTMRYFEPFNYGFRSTY